MAKGHPKKGKYWMRMYVGECPCCGKDKSYRERIYVIDEPRPVYREERCEHIPDNVTFDYCIY